MSIFTIIRNRKCIIYSTIYRINISKLLLYIGDVQKGHRGTLIVRYRYTYKLVSDVRRCGSRLSLVNLMLSNA